MESLGTDTPFGTREPIQSNLEDFCLHCGVTITRDNNSGWEAFRPDGITTQKECKTCFEQANKPGLKA